MKFPDNSIGISDLVGYLECPQRAELGMRRHTGKAAPESWSPANAYGSAIHLGIHVLDETGDVEQAVTTAFREFKQWLDPDGLQLLRDDLDTYLLREPLGYRTVFSEGEIKVPLFVHPTAGQIYFRARIDRLYVREDDDTSFLIVDYKSSRWPKSEDEVMTDPQGWAYQWGVREYMPEIETLNHRYDQLRFGMIETSKNEEQLARMKKWLIEAATAALEDDEMAPSFNDWCGYCPLRMDCSEIREGLTDFALARIAVLAPREPKLKQDGTPGKRLGPPQLDEERFAEYTAVLPKVDKAKTTLEAFSNTVKATLKEMDLDHRTELGYRLREKKNRGLSANGLRAIHEALGDDFFQIADLSRAAAERFYGKGAEELTIIDGYLEEGAPSYEAVLIT
jgi:hypothetical protein